MVQSSDLVRGMTTRHTAAGHDQTVIDRCPDKACHGVTGRAVLRPDRGMNLVGRCVSSRNTTRDMTALARRRTDGVVVHRHTGPVRITMTGFTAI